MRANAPGPSSTKSRTTDTNDTQAALRRLALPFGDHIFNACSDSNCAGSDPSNASQRLVLGAHPFLAIETFSISDFLPVQKTNGFSPARRRGRFSEFSPVAGVAAPPSHLKQAPHLGTVSIQSHTRVEHFDSQVGVVLHHTCSDQLLSPMLLIVEDLTSEMS